MAGTSPAPTRTPLPSLLPDPEADHLVGARGFHQRVAGLVEEVRDVDLGQRIGALGDELFSPLEAAERLAHAQCRQRALEPAQIEDPFRHYFPRQNIVESPLPKARRPYMREAALASGGRSMEAQTMQR